MLNTISIAGRLTKDPELRYTQNQIAVCSYSVAVERDYAGQGQQRETDFFDCVAWRQGGEFVSRYFHKGDMIIVTGRMQARDWTDNNGNKRRSWEIQVDHNYFGGNKTDSQSSQGGGQSAADYYAQHGQYGAQSAPASAPAHPQYTQQQFTEEEDDGELPF
ncbi:MAG: single-stranded DNA-binding protein [Oscillospiraceae bacterium]|nr:single-stranded DNA-binding protein [Oscillospiraceae bacterium]